jgi:chaperone required for assembly of F1-ATPase
MAHSLTLHPHPDGITLCRAGKPLLTPARHELVVPSEALAEALAAEWQALGDGKINPAKLPLTGFAALTLDVVMPGRESVTEELVEYGDTDLIFYRDGEENELRHQQDKLWQPWLDWAVKRYDTVYQATYSVTPVMQDPRNAARHKEALAELDPWQLACLAVAVKCSTSLILGLAFLHRVISAGQLFSLSRLEETYNISRWGEDSEAEAKATRTREELVHAERWRDLLLTALAPAAI